MKISLCFQDLQDKGQSMCLLNFKSKSFLLFSIRIFHLNVIIDTCIFVRPFCCEKIKTKFLRFLDDNFYSPINSYASEWGRAHFCDFKIQSKCQIWKNYSHFSLYIWTKPFETEKKNKNHSLFFLANIQIQTLTYTYISYFVCCSKCFSFRFFVAFFRSSSVSRVIFRCFALFHSFPLFVRRHHVNILTFATLPMSSC